MNSGSFGSGFFIFFYFFFFFGWLSGGNFCFVCLFVCCDCCWWGMEKEGRGIEGVKGLWGKAKDEVFWVIVFGVMIRFVLLGYGEWQDAFFNVKYTDVDFRVLSGDYFSFFSFFFPFSFSFFFSFLFKVLTFA